MRLLNKTNIYTSITTLLLLLSGAFIVYATIINKIDNERDEHLLQDKNSVIELLKEGKDPKTFSMNIGEMINITEVNSQTSFKDVFSEFSSEKIAAEEEEEGEQAITYRQLDFQTTVGQKIYDIKIAHSLSEGKEVAEYMMGAVAVFLVISLLVLIIVNRIISRSVWKPFYQILSRIKNWNIREKKTPESTFTNIDEFKELNLAINNLTTQIIVDYSNLKEFTENISHETQTPLAIISAKLEMLMQHENYSDDQQKLLTETYNAVQRLHKLNEVLTVLARIENNQYLSTKKMNIPETVGEKIAELADFFDAREIEPLIEIKSIPVKEINHILFNMLLNNLFINAIKYNLDKKGYIKVEVTAKGFSVENPGIQEKIDKKNLFDRFKRYPSRDSLGLGLSIIKKIIDFLHWEIDYVYEDGKHRFNVSWER